MPATLPARTVTPGECAAILRELASEPLAVQELYLSGLHADLTAGAKGSGMMMAARDTKPKAKAVATAIVPLMGMLFKRENWLTELGYGVSLDGFTYAVRSAAADDAVSRIVLYVDSPGGGVYGTQEAADAVAAAAKVKKVTAMVDSVCASGAYWIASQASEIILSPGGTVGSIGVYQMHVDYSEANRMEGVKPTFIYRGERKVAGNPHAPLDALGRDEMQKGVDDYYDLFTRAVARGRNVSLSKARDGFGAGGMLVGQRAVSEGMVDRIDTFDAILGDGPVKLAGGFRASHLTPAQQAEAEAMRARMADGRDLDIEIRRRRMLLNGNDTGGSKPAATKPPPPPAPAFANPTPTYTAYHEAAHLVVAVVLGDRAAHASIVSDATTLGRVTRARELAPLDEATVCYAGEFGGWMSPERATPGSNPCGTDHENAATRCRNESALRAATDRARDMVRNYSREITVVAKELLARKTLPGSFVVKLLTGL
jgi:signal peptide peptidase SppA